MVINNPIEITGSSGAILKFKNGLSVAHGASNTCLAMFFIQSPSSSGDGVKIHNLNMDGNLANVAADIVSGIFVRQGSLLQFEDNHIYNFQYPITGDSSESDTNQRFIITGNFIEGNPATYGDAGGVSIHNGGYNSIISGNTVKNSAIGIFIDSTNDTTVENNVVLSSKLYGIALYDKVYNCLVSDNIIYGSSSAIGIVSSTTPPKPYNSHNVIRDNLIHDLSVGISFDGGDSNIIEGNSLWNLGSAPASWIQVAGTTNTILRANPGFASNFSDVSNPVAAQDVATKRYVDDNFAPLGSGSGGNGYALMVQGLSIAAPADGAVYVFGAAPKIPTTTTLGLNKVYYPKAGTIKSAEIFGYATTTGSAEAWSCYLVNSTYTGNSQNLIQTISVSSTTRRWTNSSLNIPAPTGDYFEVRCNSPTWGANPAALVWSGSVYIE